MAQASSFLRQAEPLPIKEETVKAKVILILSLVVVLALSLGAGIHSSASPPPSGPSSGAGIPVQITSSSLVRSAAEEALVGLGEQANNERPASGWISSMAPALNRLQPLRWLVLAISLAGAAWLAAGQRFLAPSTAVQRRIGS